MKICSLCQKEKNDDEFLKRKDTKCGLTCHCKTCRIKRNVERSIKNKKWCAEWRKNNPVKARICSDKWRKQNPEKHNISGKLWRKNNSEYVKAHDLKRIPLRRAALNEIAAKRRASKLKRTPCWLTKAQLKEIREFYTMAKDLQWLSDPLDPLSVDHIVPLQGNNVSGLHVPWNLQILPRSLNSSKGNRL